ncbi:hypothetical protein [Geotalea sp. SG265]|uniref:hypothetical protein n=1 Tax=Geotalea sp. SG265 TaxID=2922867 RepID=UPI001FAEEEBC|nr:hypothetical protein [Geotalea sp. SG265]
MKNVAEQFRDIAAGNFQDVDEEIYQACRLLWALGFGARKIYLPHKHLKGASWLETYLGKVKTRTTAFQVDADKAKTETGLKRQVLDELAGYPVVNAMAVAQVAADCEVTTHYVRKVAKPALKSVEAEMVDPREALGKIYEILTKHGVVGGVYVPKLTAARLKLGKISLRKDAFRLLGEGKSVSEVCAETGFSVSYVNELRDMLKQNKERV